LYIFYNRIYNRIYIIYILLYQNETNVFQPSKYQANIDKILNICLIFIWLE